MILFAWVTGLYLVAECLKQEQLVAPRISLQSQKGGQAQPSQNIHCESNRGAEKQKVSSKNRMRYTIFFSRRTTTSTYVARTYRMYTYVFMYLYKYIFRYICMYIESWIEGRIVCSQYVFTLMASRKRSKYFRKKWNFFSFSLSLF